MSSLVPQSGEPMIPEIKAFRDSIRAEEQEAFDWLYLVAQERIKMMDQVGLVIPLEKALFAMLIEQQLQIVALRAELDQITGGADEV